MTCDSPFIKDTWADQAWKAWKGCSDKPKEEPRRVRHHEPISADPKNFVNFKRRMMEIKGCTEEEILRECGLVD